MRTQYRAVGPAHKGPRWQEGLIGVAGVLIVSVVAALCYRNILFVPHAKSLYPWASDTLGHVLKAEYLQQGVAEGHLYPDFFPNWYVGIQMLRYYPPLPYYLTIGLAAITKNTVTAANWFIALCALGGGLAWLPYRRWIGWLPAMAGGALYVSLPDNVRVALAEGNLPRVLATALLPLTVYWLLRSLEKEGTRWHRLALSLCFAATVLSHAMMAAIYAACCGLLALLCWAWRMTTMRRVILAVASVAIGVALAGWWLLPSLTGGITELDQQAMTEALAVFPLTTYLNPALRAGDPEIVYPGAAVLLAAALLLFVRRDRDGRTVALTLTGLFGVLISTPVFNTVFNALPLSNLFWPLRFLGVASFALLLAVLWRFQVWMRVPEGSTSPLSRWVPTVLTFASLGLLAADGALSLHLIHLRPANQDLLAVAEQLSVLPGWREATLDYSKLGSAASFLFTAQSGREQLYGWAYQGARTARNVAAINEGLQRGYTSYIVDRLALLGADDLVLLHGHEIDPELPAALETAGFAPRYDGRSVTLYHRDGAPRAYRATWPALGIGRGAQNLAYLFPQLVVGTRSQVDDYALEELIAYDTILFSGFVWEDRAKAEYLVQQVARAGVRIVVDLTGVPNDPLARQPYFLGVWGETITLAPGRIQIRGDQEQQYTLGSFSVQYGLWQTHTPQGMDVEVLYHDYLGAKSAVLGYNEYKPGRVWFVGLNLPYHAALTLDPVVVELMADLLQLPAREPNEYQVVPLAGYVASQAGYAFSYAMEAADTLVVPVAHHEGTQVLVDGEPVRVHSIERLVAFDAPAGQHAVAIQVRQTPIYSWGQVASGLALLGTVGLLTIREERHSHSEVGNDE